MGCWLSFPHSQVWLHAPSVGWRGRSPTPPTGGLQGPTAAKVSDPCFDHIHVCQNQTKMISDTFLAIPPRATPRVLCQIILVRWVFGYFEWWITWYSVPPRRAKGRQMFVRLPSFICAMPVRKTGRPLWHTTDDCLSPGPEFKPILHWHFVTFANSLCFHGTADSRCSGWWTNYPRWLELVHVK